MNTSATPAAAALVGPPGHPVRVLFVGNSYTQINDLPAIVRGLAASQGQPAECAACVADRMTLERHWNEGPAREQISGSRWDVVVLQEQSARPLTDPQRMSDYARRFAEEVKGAEARTVLMMTWARQDQPERQPAVAAAYERVAREIGATVAPVGLAWGEALRQSPGLNLHQEDGCHPSPAGAYLAGCVLYETLFCRSGADPPAAIRGADGQILIELPEARAKFLRTVAARLRA